MQQKAMELSLKDIDLTKREAVIAFATYKTLDLDGDLSNRGMFDKSWRENKSLVRYFLNHRKEEAPGKIIDLWDDDQHAYARVKHGTHTLGEDVLKQLDEQIIVAASFGFMPVRYKDIKGKGKSFTEVAHRETSVLTHWGAHSDSGPVAVVKAAMSSGIKLKQLSEVEQALLTTLMSNCMTNLQEAFTVASQLDPDSDLYTWVMWFISRHAEIVGSMRAEMRYGMKEKMDKQVNNLQKFIRNSKASDECIQEAQKSLNSLLQINSDTATTTDSSMVKCKKCGTHSVGITKDNGSIQCAECGHLVKEGSQPDASRSKDELRKKALAFKLKMAMDED